jgi:hypothetical protein
MQTIGKAILAIVIIPARIAPYYDRGKKPNARWPDWTIKNLFFWLLLTAVTAAAVLEVRTYRPELASTDKPLDFFPLSAYKAELDTYAAPQQGQTWDAEKQQLMRKFDYACYAWKAGDPNEAAKALLALETGQDQVGTLRKIPSFAVSNNLGCITFRQHRNKDFKAFLYFQAAKERVKSAEPFRTTIESNLTVLDEMVNTLD